MMGRMQIVLKTFHMLFTFLDDSSDEPGEICQISDQTFVKVSQSLQVRKFQLHEVPKGSSNGPKIQTTKMFCW